MSLKYTTDIRTVVLELVERHGGDLDAVIVQLTDNCSKAHARDMSELMAPHMGLTPAAFMLRWRALRKAKTEGRR